MVAKMCIHYSGVRGKAASSECRGRARLRLNLAHGPHPSIKRWRYQRQRMQTNVLKHYQGVTAA